MGHTDTLSHPCRILSKKMRLVYGWTRIVRLVRPVKVVKQWFMGRTGRAGKNGDLHIISNIALQPRHEVARETMAFESISIFFFSKL